MTLLVATLVAAGCSPPPARPSPAATSTATPTSGTGAAVLDAGVTATAAPAAPIDATVALAPPLVRCVTADAAPVQLAVVTAPLDADRGVAGTSLVIYTSGTWCASGPETLSGRLASAARRELTDALAAADWSAPLPDTCDAVPSHRVRVEAGARALELTQPCGERPHPTMLAVVARARQLTSGACDATGEILYQVSYTPNLADKSVAGALTLWAGGRWQESWGGAVAASGCLNAIELVGLRRRIARTRFTGTLPSTRCRALPVHHVTVRGGKQHYSFDQPCGEILHGSLQSLMEHVDTLRVRPPMDPLGGLGDSTAGPAGR
jgi:hypothetical protein